VADEGILSRIGDLVFEERRMRAAAGNHGLSGDEQRRLDGIEVELDQCWDLLNQRRALREFGEDPEQARLRDESTVEGYEQ
jgi:hypothetical protein